VNRSESSSLRIRLVILRGVVAIIFLGLVGQLWRLQTMEGEYYRQAADTNRFRTQLNPAPRGVIYDRRGHLLVRNMPQISVAIIPAYLPEEEAERGELLHRLGDLIDMPMTTPPAERLRQSTLQDSLDVQPEAGILEILAEAEAAPYRPAVVKQGVSRQAAMILEEEHLDWPGIVVQAEAVREYLYGPLMAHVLGYIGPIPESEAEEYQARGYDVNRQIVGLTGIEYSFEDEMHGQDGQELVEVDIAGRQVGVVGEPKQAVPGHNLQLTIDLDLQQAMEEILQEQLRTYFKQQAVAIAANPQTGEILGMVSLPTYDNNEFTGGISSETLQALRENVNRPLVNHAISGMFPPGSTFKIVTAAGALEEGVLTSSTRLHCGGILWLPNRYYPEDPSLAQPFYCWIYHDYHGSHGSLSIVSALGQSCDIFFYQAAGGYRDRFVGLGEERLGHYAELLGFGARSGIDLPGEAAGLVPDANWKRVNYSESWVTGDTYNMAIGQGFVLATPLQVLNAAATIANGGTLYRPQIVRQVVDKDGNVLQAFAPDVIRHVPVSAENIQLVRQGMRAVVAGAGATARGISVPGVAIAGKTGTAEFFIDRNKDGLPDRDREGNLPTHAWFTAFGPYENPEIVLVVFIFGGGEGSGVAVPVANEILNYYFSQDREGASP
jgi:penicillin-binding protein 2